MRKKKAMALQKKNSNKIEKVVYDSDVLQVIRQSIAKDLTDAEFKVYLGICKKYNADPLMKHIVPVIFIGKKGRTLNWITTRDFLLKCARDTGKFNGLRSEIIRDSNKKIIGAKAECWVKGMEHSFQTEVDFKEYYNEKNELWGKMPCAFITKCAEVSVLRKAFGIDNLYDKDELANVNGYQQIDIPKTTTQITVADNGEVVEERKPVSEVVL